MNIYIVLIKDVKILVIIKLFYKYENKMYKFNLKEYVITIKIKYS